MPLKLRGYWRSTSSWRVRIALAWKHVPVEHEPIDLRGDRRALSQSPMGKVPMLEIVDAQGRAVAIAESMAILHWLEDRFPDPPLIPRDPDVAATARMIAEMVNSGIQPFQNLQVLQYVKHTMGGDDRSWVRHWIETGLAAVEGVAARTAGTFTIGDSVTIADAYVIPQLDAARRFGVDVAAFPTLARIDQACAPLPAFVAAHPERQPDAPGNAPDRPGH